MPEPTEHVAAARRIAGELESRGFGCRVTSDYEWACIVAHDRRFAPVWVNVKYLRIRTGPGLDGVRAYGLDVDPVTVVDHLVEVAEAQRR